MHSTRDLRRRIRSISITAQITKAMQMVAASKMRRAQEAAVAGRPFVELLYRIQRAATTHVGEFHHPLLKIREVRRRAIILVGDLPYYSRVGFVPVKGVRLPGPVDTSRVLGLALVEGVMGSLEGLVARARIDRPVCANSAELGRQN